MARLKKVFAMACTSTSSVELRRRGRRQRVRACTNGRETVVEVGANVAWGNCRRSDSAGREPPVAARRAV